MYVNYYSISTTKNGIVNLYFLLNMKANYSLRMQYHASFYVFLIFIKTKMIVTVPWLTPVTTPELTTVATSVLLLVHEVAVAVVSLSDSVEPVHTANEAPKIAEGFFRTVFG